MRVLLLDDNPHDRQLTMRELEKEFPGVLATEPIDDEQFHAETVAEGLGRVGYECVIATSGEEGLRLIEERGDALDPGARAELLHAVSCHHDPRAARTAEAAVLYHANQLDAVAATRPIPE